MAKDSLKGGSEEEKKSSKGGFSDDDFGLPDLEFDDLEELDMSGDDSDDAVSDSKKKGSEKLNLSGDADFDLSLLDDSSELGGGLHDGDLDPPENTALDQGIDEVEDVLDSAQLISDRLGDDDDDSSDVSETKFNYDDLMGDAGSKKDNVSTSSLFGDIDSPDDLAALGMADEDDDEPMKSGGSLFSGDDDSDSIFGSDKLSLDEDEKDDFETAESSSGLPPNYKAYSYEESSGGFTKIVVIGIVVILVLAAGLLFFNKSNEANKEEAKVTKKIVPKKEDSEKSDDESKALEAAKVIAKPKAVVSSASPGEILSISARTSRAYVIVGSFVDGDLAMDYALKLSAQGKGVKIVEPYGNSKRYRVSVADYATFGDAASQLDIFKGEFGADVWALKY